MNRQTINLILTFVFLAPLIFIGENEIAVSILIFSLVMEGFVLSSRFNKSREEINQIKERSKRPSKLLLTVFIILLLILAFLIIILFLLDIDFGIKLGLTEFFLYMILVGWDSYKKVDFIDSSMSAQRYFITYYLFPLPMAFLFGLALAKSFEVVQFDVATIVLLLLLKSIFERFELHKRQVSG